MRRALLSRNAFPFSMEGCQLYLPLCQENMQGASLISADPNHIAAAVTGAVFNKISASDILVSSDDVEVSTTQVAYTKVKELPSSYTGQLRISFDMKNETGAQGNARIYKNGVAVGIERTNLTDSYITYSEDLADWAAGDLIQIYAHSSGGGLLVYVRNFRIYGTTTPGRSFDGIDDTIDCGNSSVLNPTSAITVEAWIYPTDVNTFRAVIGRNPAALDYGYYLYIKEVANGDLNWGVGDGAENPMTVTVADAVAINTWYHVAGTSDGATLRLYKNGVEIGVPVAAVGLNSNTAVTYIGQYRSGSAPWKGAIGEVRIYNRALSAAELLANYNVTKWRY